MVRLKVLAKDKDRVTTLNFNPNMVRLKVILTLENFFQPFNFNPNMVRLKAVAYKNKSNCLLAE